MGAFDSFMWHFDEGVTGFFGQWNQYTTTLVAVLIGILAWQIWTRQDPDTHPMLLARQAQATPVRQEGESSVYRSHAAPHGMPLNAGLNVKDPGTAKWAKGRDGDLRDIWRRAAAGTPSEDVAAGAGGFGVGGGAGAGAGTAGVRGRVLTVHGSENVVEHSIDDITRQINLIGQYLLDQGSNRVAIYLPNSVELIAALFACAFYNMTAVILPFDEDENAVISMLRRSAADTVIALPGSFPFDSTVKNYPALRQLVWVVDEGNRHLDWNEVPKGMGGAVNVSTWQDVLADQPVDSGRDLPSLAEQRPDARDVTVFWQSKPGTMEEMVRFTSGNLVAAVAAQLFAVPTAQRLSPSDLFLPADSLANTHALVLTLAALYSNASVAFNSVAGRAPDLAVATRGISPTVVVATPTAVLRTHEDTSASLLNSLVSRTVHGLQTSSLTKNGALAATTSSVLASLNDRLRPAVGRTPGKLRLLYVAERVGAGTPPLSANVLSDLRVYTGARIVYALTAARVAGAVAQTAFYDYRVPEDCGRCSHFGPPLTCTEVLLRDKGVHRTTEEKSEGEIIVRGPSVAGNEVALGAIGRIRDDNTLAYV